MAAFFFFAGFLGVMFGLACFMQNAHKWSLRSFGAGCLSYSAMLLCVWLDHRLAGGEIGALVALGVAGIVMISVSPMFKNGRRNF
jgi:hypothetical protein